jgi:hypothetical protein
MAKFYDSIEPVIRKFIEEQMIFFTASATADSRVNLSPKGIDSFRVIDEKTVAYLDLTGSGNETAAHMKADGRLTIMFCSFGPKPLILRLYGKGRLVFPRDAAWDGWHAHFPTYTGERQIVVLDVDLVQTSCGFGVPIAAAGFEKRDTLEEYCDNKGVEGLEEYRRRKNVVSIDGLPSDTVPRGLAFAD